MNESKQEDKSAALKCQSGKGYLKGFAGKVHVLSPDFCVYSWVYANLITLGIADPLEGICYFINLVFQITQGWRRLHR